MNTTHHYPTSLLRRIRCAEWCGALLWVLVLALLVRGVIPVGMMPDMNKAAAFSLKICSSIGLKTILVNVDLSQKQSSDTEKAMPKHDCVLCTAPIQADGATPDILLHRVLFLSIMAAFIAWLGAARHRHEAGHTGTGSTYTLLNN